MPAEKFTIEIAVDFNDEGGAEKIQMIEQILRSAARQVLTSAMLLQDKRKPQVVITSSNMFEGNREILLGDDLTGGEEQVP